MTGLGRKLIKAGKLRSYKVGRAHRVRPEATEACLALLKGSERAAQQWEMERRFAIFEQSVPQLPL